MQTVRLIGNISKFGEVWEMNCNNIRDIFKLIECQTPGFRQHLVNAADAGLNYEIRRGSEFLENPEEMLLTLNEEDIIITEVPAGAKSGFGKLLAAIAIVILVVATGGTAAAPGWAVNAAGSLTGIGQSAVTLATSLAINGVSQLLAPGPETERTQKEGYLFNGPSNNITQGLPVPICYGELRVGGAPISLSFRKEASTAGFNNWENINYSVGAATIPFNPIILNNTWPPAIWPPVEESNEFDPK
jgi:predicted phage tail protein